jgi:hypothetical protein
VTDIVVAANTVKFFVINYAVRSDFAYKFSVAIKAVAIQHSGVSGFDPYRLPKIPESECHGMMIAVFGFGQPFSKKIMRHVTVVACGNSVVACFLPAFKLTPHDVAIYAGLRIV